MRNELQIYTLVQDVLLLPTLWQAQGTKTQETLKHRLDEFVMYDDSGMRLGIVVFCLDSGPSSHTTNCLQNKLCVVFDFENCQDSLAAFVGLVLHK